MKIFGTLKKKTEGGVGKLLKKFKKKHCDLSLANGEFRYMNKDGSKSNIIYFKVLILSLIIVDYRKFMKFL